MEKVVRLKRLNVKRVKVSNENSNLMKKRC